MSGGGAFTRKVSGAWVFKGTRVPSRRCSKKPRRWRAADDFLEWFPGVTRDQAEEVLRHAERSLVVV